MQPLNLNSPFDGLSLPHWSMLKFAEPLWLFLLFLLPLIVAWKIYSKKRNSEPGLALASIRVFVFAPLSKHWLQYLGVFLKSMALIFIVLALARPQGGRRSGNRSAEGVDIVLVIDTSGSMKARDFEIDGKRPNRLEVIKQVILEFIEARPDDRIGLVVFGSEAFTQAPLTLDHQVLKQFLEQIEIGVAGEATAIGDGLGTAVARLRSQTGDSKVIVLLTDGANNAGRMDPLAASQAAKALKMRVHTIGVGSEGDVPIISQGQVVYIRADIDEKLLKQISDDTGGIYRRATDTSDLKSIYAEIDRLEKKKVELKDQRGGRDYFYLPLLAAIVCLLLEVLWRGTRWRVIPS
ncbi:MAG: VWA domain-containing protein [Proteobacteria bacterium]|nr:VWA domain-containing protein [Pseudomonadota bacterium]